ncbi:MAG: NUDIX domain-containing protein [Solobacterium sp.]|nr:NUDIX domain-containing protein [Solobacterium sp.]
MEYWDIYDRDRHFTGMTMKRGDPMPKGGYHIVVQVWITDGHGHFLITQRAPSKPYPLRWEPTAGSVLAKEDSLQAALREVKEEVGITLDASRGRRIASQRCDEWACPGFLDIYVFEQEFPLEEVCMQEEEVIAARWMDADEIHVLIRQGRFIENNDMFYLEDVLAFRL